MRSMWARNGRKPNLRAEKKSQEQLTFIEQLQKEIAAQNAKEVTEALGELEKQGHQVDIQVWPDAKAPKSNVQKA